MRRELFWTVSLKHTERLVELLEAKADVSERIETEELLDESILHCSAKYPDKAQLKILLQHGADILAKSKIKSENQPYRKVSVYQYACMQFDKLKRDQKFNDWFELLVSHLHKLGHPVSKIGRSRSL